MFEKEVTKNAFQLHKELIVMNNNIKNVKKFQNLTNEEYKVVEDVFLEILLLKKIKELK